MNNYKFKNTFLIHNNNNNKNNLSFSIRNINYINDKIKKKHLFNRINSNEIIYKNENFNLIFSEKESRNLKKNLILEKYSDLYKSVKKRKKFLSINNNNNNNLKNIKNSKENKNQTKNLINLNLNFIDQIKKEIKRIKLIQKNNPTLNKKKNLSQTFLNSLNTTLNKDFSNKSIKKTSNNKDFLTIQKQNYEYTNKKIPYIIKCMNKNNINNNNNNNINNIFPHTQYYENRYKKQNINLKDILINHNMNSRKDLNSNSFPKIKYKQNQMKNLFKFQNLKNKEILDIIKEKKLKTKLKTIKFNKFDLLTKFLDKQSI